jgi:pentatricopeptide repeat protein
VRSGMKLVKVSIMVPSSPTKVLLTRSMSYAGIRPLPQTYAAVLVGFLREGDIDTALAVYASNRRADVPFEGSWRALCSALFNMGDYDRATQVLKQGESEGLTPDIRMYDSMIESMCKQGDLSESIRRLKQMASSGLNPDKKVLSAVVTAHAAAGKVNGTRK